MGCRRAGWYSCDGLDNGGVPSADRIVPELQRAEVGDIFPMTTTADDAFVVRAVAPERVLVLGDAGASATWSLVLEPIDATGTRLVTRVRGRFEALLSACCSVSSGADPLRHAATAAAQPQAARGGAGRLGQEARRWESRASCSSGSPLTSLDDLALRGESVAGVGPLRPRFDVLAKGRLGGARRAAGAGRPTCAPAAAGQRSSRRAEPGWWAKRWRRVGGR
jgi:hypothetical protein